MKRSSLRWKYRPSVSRKIVIALLVCLLISLTRDTRVAAQGNTPVFAAPTNFGVGTQPTSVATGDFNLDGKPDMAVANKDSSTVSVLLNTTTPGAGAPTFAAPVDVALTDISFPTALTAIDYNRDGLPDLAVVNSGFSGISLLMNTTTPGSATPTFVKVAESTAGTVPVSIATGDFNGDGIQDLAVVNNGSNDLTIKLNVTPQGATLPSFFNGSLFLDGFPTSVAVGDLNGDGRPDLVATSTASNYATILLNKIVPGSTVVNFTAVTSESEKVVGSNPQSVVLSDFNCDGKLDIAVANKDSNNVSVLFNGTGTGDLSPTFSTAVNFNVGTSPRSIIAGDFNGDGSVELIVANQGSNGAATVSELLNKTAPGAKTPVFAPAVTFNVGTDTVPMSIVAADFNLDGKRDLALANAATNNVSVLMNTSQVGLNVAFSAPSDFLGNIRGPLITSADMNRDGKQDLVLSRDGNLVSVIMNTTKPGAITADYGPVGSFQTPSPPNTLLVGDFNGDFLPDIATTTTTGKVVVLINTTATGSITPTFANFVNIASGLFAESGTVGDFNGDGRTDLALTSLQTGTVTILVNTTVMGSNSPTFTSGPVLSTDPSPAFISTGDINNDGKPDLVVTSSSSTNVSVFLNTTVVGASTPSFGPAANFDIGTTHVSTDIADLNGDGKLDIAIAPFNTNKVIVMLNNTAPGAAVASFIGFTNFDIGSTSSAISVADINEDGIPDLVMNSDLNGVCLLTNTTVSGSTTVTMAAPVNFGFIPDLPRSFVLVDINGDGKRDLVAMQYGSIRIGTLFNTSFLSAASLAVTQINAGVTPMTVGNPFSVTIQSRDVNGNPAVVLSDTNVLLTLKTGIGTLSGNTTGTIPAGTNSVTISGLIYNKGEAGLVITVSATGGSTLTSADSSQFTVENVTPSITSLDPTLLPRLVNNVPLTINGLGFLPESVVKIAGNPHSFIFVNSTKLTVTLSSADLADSGLKGVTVTNPGPGGGTSNTKNFNVDVCGYTITPISKSFSAIGGSDSVLVTTDNGCSWTATPSDPWIHITSGGTGTATGTVSYSVDGNASFSVRSGAITITDKTLTITQAGVKSGDVNGDQVVNVNDLVAMANILAGNLHPTPVQHFAADVLQDAGSQVNVQDLLTLANFLAGNIHTLPLIPNQSAALVITKP